MFNKLFFKFLLAAAFLSFTACHKHEHDENDKQAPQLTITKPAEGAVVQGAVQIALAVTDDIGLHYMTVVVTRDSDGSEAYKQEVDVHDKTSYNFDKSFTPTGLTAETSMTLTVKAEDHGENQTVKTVKFKAKS